MMDLIVGQDCGQYLDGSQTNVGGPPTLKGYIAGKPHLHSAAAYKILKSLAIAKLVDNSISAKDEVFSDNGSTKEQSNSEINHSELDLVEKEKV